MFTIEFQEHVFTIDNNKLITEASALGLDPGDWPDHIAVTKKESSNGFLFRKSRMVDGVMIYQSITGTSELHVINY